MLGAILGAGASLLGGLMGRSNNNDNIAAQERANAANVAMQRETNAAMLADKQKDRDLQQTFAQQGIQWKAKDALAAGIHPLYAMGANTVSYAPSTVGLTSPSVSAASSSNAMGDALASAGQDISRAVSATSDAATREAAAVSAELSLTNAKLQNELLAAQVAKTRSQIGPPMPNLLSPMGNKIKQEELKQTPESIPETATISPFGIRLNTHARHSDAESLENRYGNIVEGLGGMYNLGADVVNTYFPTVYRWLRTQDESARSRKGYRPGLE